MLQGNVLIINCHLCKAQNDASIFFFELNPNGLLSTVQYQRNSSAFDDSIDETVVLFDICYQSRRKPICNNYISLN